jgi:hypothetical protein
MVAGHPQVSARRRWNRRARNGRRYQSLICRSVASHLRHPQLSTKFVVLQGAE